MRGEKQIPVPVAYAGARYFCSIEKSILSDQFIAPIKNKNKNLSSIN
jgi:hypothetical protein